MLYISHNLNNQHLQQPILCYVLCVNGNTLINIFLRFWINELTDDIYQNFVYLVVWKKLH